MRSQEAGVAGVRAGKERKGCRPRYMSAGLDRCTPNFRVQMNREQNFLFFPATQGHSGVSDNINMGKVHSRTTNYRRSMDFNLQLQNRITLALQLSKKFTLGPWPVSLAVLHGTVAVLTSAMTSALLFNLQN